MAELTKADVVKFIENMSVLELSGLIKELETKFGVSAAAPVSFAGAPVAAAAAAEEKTEFKVVLESGGTDKIKVIKEVRTITGLGLKEAKDLVEGAPKDLKEGCSKQEAEEIKKKVEAVGGKISLK
ncbi:MAG: 50S ribosomal protein L7/L12 [Proteobacteria bacterium]|nr:50S ribosomal protein L7/L12 [Pseudomonadota bacterium]